MVSGVETQCGSDSSTAAFKPIKKKKKKEKRKGPNTIHIIVTSNRTGK
jgi:hypothetical protein